MPRAPQQVGGPQQARLSTNQEEMASLTLRWLTLPVSSPDTGHRRSSLPMQETQAFSGTAHQRAQSVSRYCEQDSAWTEPEFVFALETLTSDDVKVGKIYPLLWSEVRPPNSD